MKVYRPLKHRKSLVYSRSWRFSEEPALLLIDHDTEIMLDQANTHQHFLIAQEWPQMLALLVSAGML
jgi:hypothetical protein